MVRRQNTGKFQKKVALRHQDQIIAALVAEVCRIEKESPLQQ